MPHDHSHSGHARHDHGHSHDRSEGHAGGHGHSHHGAGTSRNILAIALALTLGFMGLEFCAGLYAHSLALIADAGHMLADGAALALAWFAVHFASRPPDPRRSFGYQRFRVIATFINGFALLGIVVWIAIEAITRLMTPDLVDGRIMLWTAFAGTLVNVAVLTMLRRGDHNDMNVAAATLHVISDLFGSVAAVVAALVILWTGWMPIDPLLSLIVSVLVVRGAWSLVRQSTHILLEGTPDWLDIAQLRSTLEQRVPAIYDVHHVHAWMVGPQETLLTLHANVRQDADFPRVLSEAKAVLEKDYGIKHATIQLEYGGCRDEDCR